MKVVLTNGLFNVVFEHSKNSCGYVERMVDCSAGKRLFLKHYNGIKDVENTINEYLESGIYEKVNA